MGPEFMVLGPFLPSDAGASSAVEAGLSATRRHSFNWRDLVALPRLFIRSRTTLGVARPVPHQAVLYALMNEGAPALPQHEARARRRGLSPKIPKMTRNAGQGSELAGSPASRWSKGSRPVLIANSTFRNAAIKVLVAHLSGTTCYAARLRCLRAVRSQGYRRTIASHAEHVAVPRGRDELAGDDCGDRLVRCGGQQLLHAAVIGADRGSLGNCRPAALPADVRRPPRRAPPAGRQARADRRLRTLPRGSKREADVRADRALLLGSTRPAEEARSAVGAAQAGAGLATEATPPTPACETRRRAR